MIETRTKMYTEITIVIAYKKFNWLEKLKDFCKYHLLGISKKKLEVCI